MSEDTKKEAIKKLQAMRVKVGYPDKWIDYSKLEVNSGSYLDNIQDARRFNFIREMDKVGKPVDKEEWVMTPQTVNAGYVPSMNEIIFPAGILQPPFFFMGADDAVNYGAIGVVIGHEMTHGFDDKGRLYDKEGNLSDWWTEEDARRFEEKSQVLVEHFDEFPILDTLHVNGKLTLGENIADLGGLNVAFDGLMMSMQDETPGLIDGFTPEQRFFLAYAQLWRQNITDKELMNRLKEDVHSPGIARVNGAVANMDRFYLAFDITPDDPLYVDEAKRAHIW
jgi:putative endopeptidase